MTTKPRAKDAAAAPASPTGNGHASVNGHAGANGAAGKTVQPPASPLPGGLSVKELLFLVGAVVALLFSGSWGGGLYEIVLERQRRRPDYAYPRFEDFLLTLQALAVMCVLRVVLTQTVFLWFGEYVIDPRFKGDDRVDRVSKFATVFFKFLFFAVYTVVGFYLLLDKEWTMPAMGGSGSIVNAFLGYPFQEQMPYIKEYYLVSLAYHLHSLLFHVFVSKRRNDFLEMLLHHVVAVMLISFSYLLNFVRGGALVMLLHDVADIPGYLVKSTVDTRFKYLTLTVYVSLLAMWGYARLYVLPFEIIVPLLNGKYPVIGEALHKDGNFLPFFVFMLVTLQVMHVLWYGLFVQMGLNFLKSGKTEDIQQKRLKKQA
eukprot:Unigene3081_Nuclearia_a/m.9465 Unigene3081_Nuclearia_a/g.9465  ORF Unigene3081_Nuclearia_a/g.9465 Unigene3081_Nuclearia_a/m.9465 type:complete len:372 (+) Unigene3081_Nuclearia_a:176-1291(+)